MGEVHSSKGGTYSYSPSISTSSSKPSSYTSSKAISSPAPVVAVPVGSSSKELNEMFSAASKSSLINAEKLLKEYIGVVQQIDSAKASVIALEQRKKALEEKLANNPEFLQIKDLINSISTDDSKGLEKR